MDIKNTHIGYQDQVFKISNSPQKKFPPQIWFFFSSFGFNNRVCSLLSTTFCWDILLFYLLHPLPFWTLLSSKTLSLHFSESIFVLSLVLSCSMIVFSLGAQQHFPNILDSLLYGWHKPLPLLFLIDYQSTHFQNPHFFLLQLNGGRSKTKGALPVAQEETCVRNSPRQVSCTGPVAYKDL